MYRLLSDAYYGTGGFADGSYLKKHKRENEEGYRNRRELAYYLNYFAPVVNAHVDPIFKKKPARNWEGPLSDVWELFMEDVDNAGTSMQSFVKKAALRAKLYGGVFIVMDNFKNMPEKLGATMKERKFPYAYILNLQRVESYKLDKVGKLLELTYTETIESGTAIKKERITTLTGTEIRITDTGEPTSITTHDLGVVPAIFFSARDSEKNTIKPPSEFTAIAKTCRNIYNVCSWLTEIMQNQAFNILVYPDKSITNLVIGTNNALGFDGDESKHMPAFIAPDSAPATILIEQINLLVQEVYRMAGLSFITGTKQESSGIAKAWEFERTNQTLSDFAERCQSVEVQMAKLFAAWMDGDLTYTADYPNDFGIVDIKTELENAQAILDLNLVPQIKEDVLAKVLDCCFAEMPPERFDALMAGVRSEAIDALHGNATDIATNSGSEADIISNVALNGAQVSAAVDVLSGVSAGTIPEASAVLMLINFFGMSVEVARELVEQQKKVKAPAAGDPHAK